MIEKIEKYLKRVVLSVLFWLLPFGLMAIGIYLVNDMFIILGTLIVGIAIVVTVTTILFFIDEHDIF